MPSRLDTPTDPTWAYLRGEDQSVHKSRYRIYLGHHHRKPRQTPHGHPARADQPVWYRGVSLSRACQQTGALTGGEHRIAALPTPAALLYLEEPGHPTPLPCY